MFSSARPQCFLVSVVSASVCVRTHDELWARTIHATLEHLPTHVNDNSTTHITSHHARTVRSSHRPMSAGGVSSDQVSNSSSAMHLYHSITNTTHLVIGLRFVCTRDTPWQRRVHCLDRAFAHVCACVRVCVQALRRPLAPKSPTSSSRAVVIKSVLPPTRRRYRVPISSKNMSCSSAAAPTTAAAVAVVVVVHDNNNHTNTD